jgi:hypothetical protein
MNEWIYVLTVEALVFGLLGTLVTAQRLDVLTWPEDETWPVFGTSILAILAYSLSLLVICSVITASRLGSLAEDVCHAFSRSAGRLVTVAGLWVIFQSTVVYANDKRHWPLLLCQLWGTTCKDPGAVLWAYSYSMYLAVLLPLLVWCGGLQIVASGKLVSDKITRKTSARRILTMNVLSILLLHSTYTIQENFSLGCEQGCPESTTSQSSIKNQEVQGPRWSCQCACSLWLSVSCAVTLSREFWPRSFLRMHQWWLFFSLS